MPDFFIGSQLLSNKANKGSLSILHTTYSFQVRFNDEAEEDFVVETPVSRYHFNRTPHSSPPCACYLLN